MRSYHGLTTKRWGSALHGRGRRVASLLVAGGVALAAGGCSLSFPIGSLFGGDDLATGSISPAEPPVVALAPDLTAEDWRRARGALTLALDPQGNGAPVTWDNPESGRNGRFAPVGQPFVTGDEICRAFRAEIEGRAAGRQLEGVACRPSGGEWSLKSVSPATRPAG